MTPQIRRHWATPYTTFTPNGEVDILEFTSIPGNGRFHQRHYMEIARNSNFFMDVAGCAEHIVVAMDPGLPEEASYLVNNFLCAMMAADRSKIQIQTSYGLGGITVNFYYGALPKPKAVSPKKKHTSHRSHHGGHHTAHPKRQAIHVF